VAVDTDRCLSLKLMGLSSRSVEENFQAVLAPLRILCTVVTGIVMYLLALNFGNQVSILAFAASTKKVQVPWSCQ
jgi:hypothetical protein